MYRVLEHIVHKVWIRLNKIIEHLEYFEVPFLPFIKSAKTHFIGEEFDLVHGLCQFLSITDDCLISLPNFLSFLLQTFKFFVDLFFHHGVEVLLLDF